LDADAGDGVGGETAEACDVLGDESGRGECCDRALGVDDKWSVEVCQLTQCAPHKVPHLHLKAAADLRAQVIQTDESNLREAFRYLHDAACEQVQHLVEQKRERREV